MTSLVLLPGMDGTGELFTGFVKSLRATTKIIAYPVSQPLNYAQLEEHVCSELPPDEPYVLLAESFSGPIALSIAAKRPEHLCGVVLCCSFARNPRPAWGLLRGLVHHLPDRLPIAALLWLLAGRFATRELRQALSRALAQVSPAVLRARLAAVIETDVLAIVRSVRVPVLYIRGTEDRVVPSAASRLIARNAPQLRLVELVAPHFLLQAIPGEAAGVVQEFLDQLGGAA